MFQLLCSNPLPRPFFVQDMPNPVCSLVLFTAKDVELVEESRSRTEPQVSLLTPQEEESVTQCQRPSAVARRIHLSMYPECFARTNGKPFVNPFVHDFSECLLVRLPVAGSYMQQSTQYCVQTVHRSMRRQGNAYAIRRIQQFVYRLRKMSNKTNVEDRGE